MLERAFGFRPRDTLTIVLNRDNSRRSLLRSREPKRIVSWSELERLERTIINRICDLIVPGPECAVDKPSD